MNHILISEKCDNIWLNCDKGYPIRQIGIKHANCKYKTIIKRTFIYGFRFINYFCSLNHI